ncbi:hypothetical protein BGZ54_006909 [Gamsiella multidivaricata]|nr:hypothetical protein BGZ54_006909 [Gamsiella multidivaricata]
MRFSTAASVAALLAVASVASAQDANCSAVIADYAPSGNGKYQKCYTEQQYNAALVSAGGSPNYPQIIQDVCSQKACAHSDLVSATTRYVNACNASMDAETTNSNGNILQIGKNALEIFFAEPIRDSYCAVDPDVPVPTTAPGAPAPTPSYCLAASVANPANRFVSNLAIYLTAGSIRSSQEPFFIANNLDSKDVCSHCSQAAVNSTISYLSQTLMPRVAQFYTPEFVQYWTKLVPAYNTLCKTSYTQKWPVGTLNQTVPDVPTGSPTAPATALPTATGAAPTTATPTNTSGAGSIKPVAGVATALLMAVAALL